MHDQHFETEDWVPESRNAVFAFFSDPNNLESITPAWLRSGAEGGDTTIGAFQIMLARPRTPVAGPVPQA